MRPAERTRVKICGITRVEDARVALDAGADWIGFIMKGESPRLLDETRATMLAAALDGAPIVAVMVSPTPDEALALAHRAGAARVQLHRIDPNAWPIDFPLPMTLAISVTPDGSLADPLPPDRFTPLLDTADPELAGGTGRTFPWETARVVAATRPVVLAGGLDAGNVAKAVGFVRPFGVDASSRLESAPGIKDPDRVRSFIAAVRACDERLASS